MRLWIVRCCLAVVLVASASLAAAQTPAPERTVTVTVTATGSASGPVSGLIVQAVVVGKTVSSSDLQTTLEAAGVTNVISDNTPLSAFPNAAGLRGIMPGFAKTDIEHVRNAVNAYVAKNKDAVALRIHFFGLAVDCAPIAAKARDAALAQAHDNAEQLAAVSGGRLGTIVSVAETNGCPEAGRLGGSYAVDAATVQMRVPVSETVTYAVLHP